MSVRSAVALEEGADEDLLAKVGTYETSDLTEFQKAALRLADVYLGVPSATDDDLRAVILAELTPTQTAMSLKANVPTRWMHRACFTGKRRWASATIRSPSFTASSSNASYSKRVTSRPSL